MFQCFRRTGVFNVHCDDWMSQARHRILFWFECHKSGVELASWFQGNYSGAGDFLVLYLVSALDYTWCLESQQKYPLVVSDGLKGVHMCAEKVVSSQLLGSSLLDDCRMVTSHMVLEL